jgi:hypothetical protein
MSRPGGALSRFVIIVAPVVVMPDMASKKASVKDSCRAEIIKGMDAKAGRTIQANDVNKKVCLSVKVTTPVRAVINMAVPTKAVKPEAIAKAAQSAFPALRSTTEGMTIPPARMISNKPMTKNTGLKSITIIS